MPRPLIGINCDYAHRPSGEKRLALNLSLVPGPVHVVVAETGQAANPSMGFFGATDPAVRAAGVPGPARRDRNNWVKACQRFMAGKLSRGVCG